MKAIATLFYDRHFAKFLFACAIAAGVNFGSRMLLGLVMGYVSSIIIAYILGIITAYMLCRATVFKSTKNSMRQEIFYFILVNVFAIIQTVVVSLALNDYVFKYMIHDVFLRKEISHFIGICFPAFTSFVGHKYLSFR
jgi:putative flippase GtrA